MGKKHISQSDNGGAFAIVVAIVVVIALKKYHRPFGRGIAIREVVFDWEKLEPCETTVDTKKNRPIT